jgi:hypothetical protein
MFGGKSTGGDGAPGMGNDVDRTTDALDDRGDLVCRDGRAAKRRVGIGRCAHLTVTIRAAVTGKIERPDIETGSLQIICPGTPVEFVADGQARRERGAVDIEDRLTGAGPAVNEKVGSLSAMDDHQAKMHHALVPMFRPQPSYGRRRKIRERLLAGISSIAGGAKPWLSANSTTASRSRTPQPGLRVRRFSSNAALLGAVWRPPRR